VNVRSALLPLLIAAHCLVDIFASTIQPLWPDLQSGLALDDGAIQGAYVTWSLSTSVSQLFFGYWGDRSGRRWLIWAGPALGVVCLSGIGLVHSPWMLHLLLLLGGLGIAAFHPEAAALAGASTPGHRSRAMSLFAVGGSLGQALGPVYSGVVTTRYGLPALAWSLVWGLSAVVFLGLGLRGVPAEPEADGGKAALSWSVIVGRRGGGLALLLMIGVFRVLPLLGVPLALAFALKGRGDTNEQIGLAQAVFLTGSGGGSLGCALFVRRASERRVLWMTPLPLVLLLAVLPWLGFGLLLAGVGVAGVLLGATMPILVSYGQQLLPEGRRTASSITMGVTWGLGGLIVAATMAASNRLGRPELAFAAFGLACLVSSVLCAWLPEPGHEHGQDHDHEPGSHGRSVTALAPQPR
jgi:FSR family fosmidomycin resistance protein-like MFS transporter